MVLSARLRTRGRFLRTEYFRIISIPYQGHGRSRGAPVLVPQITMVISTRHQGDICWSLDIAQIIAVVLCRDLSR